MRPIIAVAVEGPTDEAVACKLIQYVCAQPGPVYGKEGQAHLRQRVASYNHAAGHAPWLVLVDLDRDADCAPPLCHIWPPKRAPLLCLRVAVRAVEAWLLADAERLAAFLGVAPRRIAAQPEQLDDPKGDGRPRTGVASQGDSGGHGAARRQRPRRRPGIHFAPDRVRHGPLAPGRRR